MWGSGKAYFFRGDEYIPYDVVTDRADPGYPKRMAEGGGGDGTLCRFTTRRISGIRFDNDPRTLWGRFDCTRVGLPES